MNEKPKGSEPIGTTNKPNSSVVETNERDYQTCIWNGHEYSPGAYVCRGNNKKLICQPNGSWIEFTVVKCI